MIIRVLKKCCTGKALNEHPGNSVWFMQPICLSLRYMQWHDVRSSAQLTASSEISPLRLRLLTIFVIKWLELCAVCLIALHRPSKVRPSRAKSLHLCLLLEAFWPRRTFLPQLAYMDQIEWVCWFVGVQSSLRRFDCRFGFAISQTWTSSKSAGKLKRVYDLKKEAEVSSEVKFSWVLPMSADFVISHVKSLGESSMFDWRAEFVHFHCFLCQGHCSCPQFCHRVSSSRDWSPCACALWTLGR
jgi:hypothetical protein